MLAQDQNYPPAPKLEDYESPQVWWEALAKWFWAVSCQVHLGQPKAVEPITIHEEK